MRLNLLPPIPDAEVHGPYDTALDLLADVAALAARARALGWEVNVALVSGPVEQITFAAQRVNPAVAG
jgi:hypothetical protein